jgi:tetratricopeptide (TPR) repeat protein
VHVPDIEQTGAPMREHLNQLVDSWGQGKVSLKQIVGLGDDELYAIANQGYYLFVQGKNEPARVLFEGLVAIDPRNAYYYRALGAIYWRVKEPQSAIRQFTYAIRVSPREISSYVNRAEIYVAQRQFKLARSDLQFALSTAGTSDRMLVRKARAMLRMIAQ